MLVLVSVLQVTGAWTAAMTWLRVHWISGYELPCSCHHGSFGKIKIFFMRNGRW